MSTTSSSDEQPTGHDVTMIDPNVTGHDVTMAPSSSASKPLSSPHPTSQDVTRASKRYKCGQDRCAFSSEKKGNVKRHRKNSCHGIPIDEWKLQERTCQLCGQELMVMKEVKKHQRTAYYCQKQQEKKRQGLPAKMYNYSE